MIYQGYFKDIDMNPYLVDIYTSYEATDPIEITLTDTPVIVSQRSGDVLSPIKGQTCTINILSNEAMWDLYTTDPQGIRVIVTRRDNGFVVFRGYATPLQYNQDWTTLDTLSLECVDLVSSLKELKYTQMGEKKAYVPIDVLLSWIFSHSVQENDDSIWNWFRFHWPKTSFKKANKYNLANTPAFLHAICLNEANFYDDDDEKTPWSYWEVLEEICKYLCVSLTCYNGQYWFIDYQYAAVPTIATRQWWVYNLDLDYEEETITKSVSFTSNGYAAGTSSVATDDTYNVVAVNANRYDIDEIAEDAYDEKRHMSITLEKDFGGSEQVFTIQETNFWGTTVTAKTYCYKTFGRPSGLYTTDTKPWSNWKCFWYNPRDFDVPPTDAHYMPPLAWPNYYSSNAGSYSQYTNLPENKWINTIGATFVEYCCFDGLAAQPQTADWKQAIMFNCLTDTIQPESTNTQGKYKVSDLYDDMFEVPAMQYNSEYELNFSPSDGKSWLVLNGALWYQQNKSTNKKTLTVTNTATCRQTMFPIEDSTDWDSYYQYFTYANIASAFCIPYNSSWNPGWNLMKFKLQIGDKWWNGSSWTTTESTFYPRFTANADTYITPSNSVLHDTETQPNDSFCYLKWMDMVSTTDYTDKVGLPGYAIPIDATDGICGSLKLTLYMPRMLPKGQLEYTQYRDADVRWYTFGPVVFMKDLSLKYVYTDETPWYLRKEVQTDDLQYKDSSDKTLFRYEKQITSKINTWQKGRPIAKSFPIIDTTITSNGQSIDVCEYVTRIMDPFGSSSVGIEQEYNMANRQLRHYQEPRKKLTCHRKEWTAPWMTVSLPSSSGLDNIVFIVGDQEFDVRNRNVTVTIVEYGDATDYSD